MNRLRHPDVSIAFSGLLLAAILLTGGCTSTRQPVHATQDPNANFDALATFGWDKDADAQASAVPTSILDTQIRAAISNELQQKGYTEAAAGTNPQLLLHYQTDAAEKVRSNPFRIGVGVGGYGSRGGASVGVSSPSAKNVREGTLVLRAIDPARNAEVWNGRVSRELGKGGPPDQTLIDKAVGELLREFPSRRSEPR